MLEYSHQTEWETTMQDILSGIFIAIALFVTLILVELVNRYILPGKDNGRNSERPRPPEDGEPGPRG